MFVNYFDISFLLIFYWVKLSILLKNVWTIDETDGHLYIPIVYFSCTKITYWRISDDILMELLTIKGNKNTYF